MKPNLNELTRHDHPMAGKRSANDQYARRAIAGGYVYKCMVYRGAEPKHPGRAMIFKYPKEEAAL